jgi:hypothetical protein
MQLLPPGGGRTVTPWKPSGVHATSKGGNAMNRTVSKLLPACAFAFAAAVASPAVAGPVDCTRPAIGTGEVQACRAASQGVDELRRFIQRTRGIYILFIHDFASAVRT